MPPRPREVCVDGRFPMRRLAYEMGCKVSHLCVALSAQSGTRETDRSPAHSAAYRRDGDRDDRDLSVRINRNITHDMMLEIPGLQKPDLFQRPLVDRKNRTLYGGRAARMNKSRSPIRRPSLFNDGPKSRGRSVNRRTQRNAKRTLRMDTRANLSAERMRNQNERRQGRRECYLTGIV